MRKKQLKANTLWFSLLLGTLVSCGEEAQFAGNGGEKIDDRTQYEPDGQGDAIDEYGTRKQPNSDDPVSGETPQGEGEATDDPIPEEIVDNGNPIDDRKPEDREKPDNTGEEYTESVSAIFLSGSLEENNVAFDITREFQTQNFQLTQDELVKNLEKRDTQIERPNHSQMAKQGNSGENFNDNFKQKEEGLLDILLVIDDSISMTYEQTQMANNFASFTQSFVNKNWQVLITTTSESQFSDGKCIGNKGKLIKKDDTNAAQAIEDHINSLGAKGDGDERGFYTARAALECESTPWLRNGSSLAVFFVSDEDNCSNNECINETEKDITYLTDVISSKREIGTEARFYAMIHHNDVNPPAKLCNPKNDLTQHRQGNKYMELIKSAVGAGENLEHRIQDLIKSSTDKLIKDTGNFTREYVSLFQNALNQPIDCHLFHWTSENHHMARIKGLIKLCDYIVQQEEKGNQFSHNLILIGHSHAGQIFALLSHLTKQTPIGLQLEKFITNHDLVENTWDANLKQIRKFHYRFVTLGTPTYYPWAPMSDQELLHFINHRGNNLLTGNRQGTLTTKYGDYIQQLGIEGSDFPATSPRERKLNKEIDEILQFNSVKLNLNKKKLIQSKISSEGKTLLIDYKDESKTIPNCVRTICGHGIYTQYNAMLFNAKILSEHFLSE